MRPSDCKRLLLVALLAPVLAGADERLIEEVVVTATKREQGAYEVPAALSVLQGHELAERGIGDLVDVGKFVPNMNVTTFAAGHTSSANPFVRGIGMQDHLITTDPGVSVYVDGIYLGRQVGQHWNLSNLERIEVLRGPQGTLYGRNSIGGAINLIPTPPGSDPGVKIGAALGSRNRKDMQFLGDWTFARASAASFSGSIKTRGGVGSFLNLPQVAEEVGSVEEYAGRLALAFDPSDRLAILIALDASRGRGGLNPYTTLIDQLPHGALYQAGYRNADIAADPYDNNTGQLSQTSVGNSAEGLGLRIDWDSLPSASLHLRLGLRRSEYQAGLDDDGFINDFLSFPEEGKADQESIEAHLVGDWSGIEYILGGYYFREKGENRQDPTVFLGLKSAFWLRQAVTSRALFAHLTRDLGHGFSLSGGLRFTQDQKRAKTDVGIGEVGAERTWQETSWEISLRRALRERVTAYASLQSGYQSGQFPARPYCLFTNQNCFAAGDNITAVNYELGIKGQPWETLEMSLALFRTKYEQLPYQVSSTTKDGFNTVNVVVSQVTKGVEWEGYWRVSEAFLLRATLGYLEVEIDRALDVRPVAPLTPELTYSISPEFRYGFEGGGEMVARLDYSFRGHTWGEPSSDPGRFTRIDERALINAHFGYAPEEGNWSIAFYARNLLDERYDHARLNTGDYVLRILSNDVSEFGLRIERFFGK